MVKIRWTVERASRGDCVAIWIKTWLQGSGFYQKSNESIKKVNYSLFMYLKTKQNVKLFPVNNLRNDEVVLVNCNI